MPSGLNLVTGLPFDSTQYESEHSILDAELKNLVLSEIPSKSAKHKSKAKKTGADATGAAAAAAPPKDAAPAQ